jgi:hypothetical protein
VIDFRYHVVSIVAVFLALAIGIVFGSTELQGTTIDVLRNTSQQIKNQYDATHARNVELNQQVSEDQAVAAAGPSTRVTGSPRWLVRAQVSRPPGGLRDSAA